MVEETLTHESESAVPTRFQLKIEHAIPTTLVLGMAAYWLWVTSRATALGFPLDDAWIHAQFARNLANGDGFSFNPGIPSSGSTAPLWTLLLAIPMAVGVPPVPAALGLGILLTCATVVAASELTRVVTGSRVAGLYAGCCVALSGRVTWASVSGMEGPLFAFLTVVALLAYVTAVADPKRSAGLWGLAAGLAGAARPEAFVVFPVLEFHWLIGPGAADRRRDSKTLLRPIVWFGLVVTGYVALNIYGGGHPLPMTFYAKTGTKGLWAAVAALDLQALREIGAWPLVSLNKLALFFIGHSALLFAALVVGLLALTDVLRTPRLRMGASIVAGVLLVSPILKGLLAPVPSILVHLGRYITHLTVLYMVAATIGLFVLYRLSKRSWVVVLIALLAVARLGTQNLRDARVNVGWTKNINDLQVVTGKWLADHTSPDAVIATNDIGALAYYSKRFIVDTEGLVTPEAIAFKREETLTPFLRQARPDLVVIFPEWYPEAVGSPLLLEIRRFSAPKVVAGGPTLVAYRLPWTRSGTVDPTVSRPGDAETTWDRPSETERRVLEALWVGGPGTVADVQNAVNAYDATDYATVLQTLDKLVEKELVVRDGRSYVYSAKAPGPARKP